MKKFILFAAAAAMLAACSSDDLSQQEQLPVAQASDAISFDAYMQRSTTTRAGWAGSDATTTKLQTTTPATPPPLGASGFGVFAYYTDNFDYTPLYVPNFMYNEQVTWNSSSNKFEYNLPKYWPNEHGSAAKSSDQDRVSFFAYLPYVHTDPSTGMIDDDTSLPENQWGIMGMKRNSVQGDPIIQYITSFDQQHSVDLCWGTTPTTDDVAWATNSSTQTIAKGKPWLNVRKPDGIGSADASKVNFFFQHATARLMVNVQTDFTEGWESLDPTTDQKTRVWVRSIRFTGIARKAALNLNNPKANVARWIDYYGNNELEMGESVTVYDGRKDGSEGVLGAESVNETVLGINPNLIQKEGLITSGTPSTWNKAAEPRGVQPTTSPLFCNNTGSATQGIFVIPTGEKVDVEIVYDIETIDEKLPVYLSDGETHGSTVENRILKQNVYAKLESGKSYTLNLRLGMKDVKFTATVNDSWETQTPQNVDLPSNIPTYTATSTPTNVTMTIPGSATSFKFAVTGLAAEETVTAEGASPVTTVTAYNNSGFTGTTGKASASGMAYVDVSAVDTHTDVVYKENASAVTVTGSTSLNKVIVKLVQEPTALGLVIPASTASSTTYTYTNAHSGKWQESNTAYTSVAPYVKVWVDDVELEKNDSPGAGQFKFDNGTLILGGDAPTNGKVVKITIKTGDVPAETKSFTVGA